MELRIMGSETARVLQAGPFRKHIDGFVAVLRAAGYTVETIRSKLTFVAQLSHWIERRGLALPRLDQKVVARFLRVRRRRYRGYAGARATIFQLHRYLRTTGVARTREPAARRSRTTAVEAAYRAYLRQERGLCGLTIDNYAALVRPFLAGKAMGPQRSLRRRRSCDVTRFVVRHVGRMSPGRAKLLGTAMRSLLRFLHVTDKTAIDLAPCVPRGADWRHARLPKFISADHVARLIDSCERRCAGGRRDRAIMLLLARLGLRAGEVVKLTLDDLHWEAGELVVHGKGKRCDRLPLPRDVGEALAVYLRDPRPPSASRRLFLCARAPRRGFTSSAAISTIVRRAIDRVGLRTPSKGAHLLRHSLATDLLRRGARLDEIGELLRHRSPDTTVLYAKVDFAALRDIAPPWPGGAA